MDTTLNDKQSIEAEFIGIKKDIKNISISIGKMEKQIEKNGESVTMRSELLLSIQKTEIILGQVLVKLEEMTQKRKEDIVFNDARYDKIDNRVTKLELWRSGIVAVIGIFSFLAPFVISFLINKY